MKTKFESLYVYFLPIISIFAPIKPILFTVVVLIIADFITGIAASVKEKGWKSIKSAIMRDIISKIILYSSAVMCSYLVEKFLLDEALPLSKLAGSAIGLVELKSLYENIERIRGVSLFSELIGKLGSRNRQPEDSSSKEQLPPSDEGKS